MKFKLLLYHKSFDRFWWFSPQHFGHKAFAKVLGVIVVVV